jgi:GxxExxY protein
MLLHENVTKIILKAFFQVYRDLGYGFREQIYEIAMAMTAQELGLEVNRQELIIINYKGKTIGKNKADMVINDLIIVEIKAAKALCEEHEAQLLNYLKATKYEVGLLLNFGYRSQFKRLVFENDRKGTRSTQNARKNADEN